MSKYVLRRLLLLVPTLIGMSLLIFFMLRLLPGDVVDLMTGGDIPASAEPKQQLREALGLDDPLPVQYVKWVGAASRRATSASRCGRASRSRPCCCAALPVTLELTLLAVVMAHGRARSRSGVVSAVRRETASITAVAGGRADRAVVAELLAGNAGAAVHLVDVPLGPAGQLRVAVQSIRSATWSRCCSRRRRSRCN